MFEPVLLNYPTTFIIGEMTENSEHPIVQKGKDKGRISNESLATEMAYAEKSGRVKAKKLEEEATSLSNG